MMMISEICLSSLWVWSDLLRLDIGKEIAELTRQTTRRGSMEACKAVKKGPTPKLSSFFGRLVVCLCVVFVCARVCVFVLMRDPAFHTETHKWSDLFGTYYSVKNKIMK